MMSNGIQGHNVLTHWGQDKMTNIFQEIFKCIFLKETVWISIKISLKFVLKDPTNNINSIIGSDNGLAPVKREAII